MSNVIAQILDTCWRICLRTNITSGGSRYREFYDVIVSTMCVLVKYLKITDLHTSVFALICVPCQNIFLIGRYKNMILLLLLFNMQQTYHKSEKKHNFAQSVQNALFEILSQSVRNVVPIMSISNIYVYIIYMRSYLLLYFKNLFFKAV